MNTERVQPALRAGTWNVEYATGKERNRLRLARLLARPADLWILTETHDDLDLSATHTAVSTAQRPARPAGERWTTTWTRWPVLERIPVSDPLRTVAALLQAPGGTIAVYGTVLPWHSDHGPGTVKAKYWSEQDRVLPIQLAEWRAIQHRYPGTPLLIAGDLNMSLGGKHYYGTARGRAALKAGLAALELGCATEYGRLPTGALQHSPIDHIVLPLHWLDRARVIDAWEGTDPNGQKLSDHSGLLVEVDL